jgi:mersacidin/lichenicidin family type 2 lantibiotic
MPTVDVIRAWKDEEYRLSLSDEQRSLLPQHPAGAIELSNQDFTTDHGHCTIVTASAKQPLPEADHFAI